MSQPPNEEGTEATAGAEQQVREGPARGSATGTAATSPAATVVVAPPSASPSTSTSSLSDNEEEAHDAPTTAPTTRYPLRTISTQPEACAVGDLSGATASSTTTTRTSPRDKLKLKLGSDAALAPTNRSLKPVHEFTHAYLRRKWEDEHHVALTRLVKAYENAGQEIDWEEVGSQIGRSATAAISKWKRLEHTKTVPRVPGSKKRPRGVSSSSSSLSAAGAALSGLSLPSNASSGPMSPSSGASRKTSGKRAQARQTTLKETRRTIKLTTSDQETGSAPTASKGVKCRSEAQTPGAEADEREPKLIAIKEDTPVSSVEVFVERKAVHAPFEPAGASSFKEPLVRTSAPTSSLHIAPSFRPWTPSEDFSLVYSVILCGEQSWDVVMNERAPETQHHPPYASDQGRSLPSLRECGRSVDEVVSRWFSNWRTRVAEHGDLHYASSSLCKEFAEPHPYAQLPTTAPLMSREPTMEPSPASLSSFQSFLFSNLSSPAPPASHQHSVSYDLAQAHARDQSQPAVDTYQSSPNLPLPSPSYYSIPRFPLSLPPESIPMPSLEASPPLNLNPHPHHQHHAQHHLWTIGSDSRCRSPDPDPLPCDTSTGGAYRPLFRLHDQHYLHQAFQSQTPRLPLHSSSMPVSGAMDERPRMSSDETETETRVGVEEAGAGAGAGEMGEHVRFFPLDSGGDAMHQHG